MAKSNVLGTFIRNKRQDKGFLDVTSFARRLSRSVSYVSRVELGNSDGPSLKFLNEIAQVLEVDLKYLVELKELDNSSESAASESSARRIGSDEGIRLDEAVRRAVASSARLETNKGDGETVSHIETLGLRPDLDKLGKTHLDMAEKFLDRGMGEKCLEHLEHALGAYEQLGDGGGVALACFSIGRAHRRMAHDPSYEASARLNHLTAAHDWFGGGYAAFSENSALLSDELRGRMPECLSQWARTDEQIAMHIFQPEDTPGDGLNDDIRMQAYIKMRSATQTYYKETARTKREIALTQYEEWIEQLDTRIKDETDERARYALSKELASTYQRLGVLCRDLGCAEGSSAEIKNKYRQMGVSAFLAALQRQRILVLACPDSPELIQRSLDRLANTHADFGVSILLHGGSEEASALVAVREEAYWQFRVAQRLYAMLGFSSEDMRVDYVDSQLIGVEREQVLESEIVSRQNMERLLAQSDFGTSSHPAFGYPLTYHLGTDRAEEQPLLAGQ